jgi:hypothetical protein
VRRQAAIAICALAVGFMSTRGDAQLLGDWGYGSFNVAQDVDEGSTLSAALGLPGLYGADGDVFRFSAAPALGGRGFVITLSELPKGAGRIEAILIHGHHGLGWTRQATMEARLSPEAYAEALARVDALYRPLDYAAIPGPNDPSRVIALCTDGPGYLSERNRDGEVTWLSGHCADNHPNPAIAGVMRELVEHAFADAWRPFASDD